MELVPGRLRQDKEQLAGDVLDIEESVHPPVVFPGRPRPALRSSTPGEGRLNFTITSQMPHHATNFELFHGYRNVVGFRVSPPREQLLSPRSA